VTGQWNRQILKSFAREADQYLFLLEDPATSVADRRAAAHALSELAGTLEFSRIRDQARLLASQLDERDRLDGLSALRQSLEDLRQIYRTAELRTIHLEGPEDADDDTDPAFDRDAHWDSDTARVLHQVFMDEAGEHLDFIMEQIVSLPQNPGALRELLRRTHTLKGSAGTVGMSAVGRAAHRIEERLVQLNSAELIFGDALVDALLSVAQCLGALVKARTGAEQELLLHQLDTRLSQLDPEAFKRQTGTRRKQRRPSLTTQTLEGANIERRQTNDRRRDEAGSIRVEVGNVEELINAADLVVAHRADIDQQIALLEPLLKSLAVANTGSAHPPTITNPAGDTRQAQQDTLLSVQQVVDTLRSNTEGLGAASRELQSQLTRIRMMPVKLLFSRLQLPLREMARKEGKLVRLSTLGEDAVLDRAVGEQISDPLIHLLRNAVAHGIEIPSIRRKKGKPEVGSIRLTARYQADFLCFEIEDDGAGVDVAGLRQKLLVDGRIDDTTADGDLLKYLFSSGFSTRKTVDDLAGRGVGLDVVQEIVESMGGEIAVRSRLGGGTLFTVRLPMATALSRALFFRTHDQVYGIGLSQVVETLPFPPDQNSPDDGELPRVKTRHGWVPLIHLQQVLTGNETTQSPPQNVVVVSSGNLYFGISVGELLGSQDVTLKRLGPLLRRLPLLDSATITDSGIVRFLLNVAALADAIRQDPLRQTDTDPLRPPARILLADDSRPIREAVGIILRDAGYLVDVAADGWEAWERLQQRDYQLLISDLEMPKTHGLELITKCRHDPILAELPILVLTSRSAPRHAKASRDRGADDFLSKPIQPEQLLAAAVALIGSEIAREKSPNGES
jgi:chemosensory pili system protein ChpA (sensor histidine kinase/response regulator)